METLKSTILSLTTHPIAKRIIKHILVFGGGILAGRICLVGDMYIGAEAYIVAAAFSPAFIAAFIGTLLGRMTLGINRAVPVELIPQVLCFSTFLLLRLTKNQPKKIIYVLVCFIARLPLLVFSSLLLYDVLKFMLSLGFACCCAYCFISAYEAFRDKNIKGNMIIIVTSAALLISAFPINEIYEISLFMTAASVLIILSATMAGSAQAGAAGAIIGLSAVLASGANMEIAGALAICGAVSGACKEYSKYVVVPMYVLTAFLLSLLSNSTPFSIISYQSLIIASSICLVIPQKFLWQAGTHTQTKERIKRWRSVDLAAKKVSQFSNCLISLKNVFDEISTPEITPWRETAPALQIIAQQSCKDCEMEKDCWNKNLYNTYRELGSLISDFNKDKPPTTYNIPKAFYEKCTRKPQLYSAIISAYNTSLIRHQLSLRIQESRMLVKKHLSGSAAILDEMADNMLATAKPTESRVYDALANNENLIYPIHERDGEYTLKCKNCGGIRRCKKYANQISRATRTTHIVESRRCGNSATPCAVLIRPAHALRLSYGATQHAKSGSICGDAFIMKRLSKGSCLLAVADGMGSGPRAAIEAKATIELLNEFLDAGFHEDTVFSIINRALLLRSGSETFSTLDACIIDPIERCYRFLKVGAPPSYILRENTLIPIQSPSMPLGILESTECVCIKRDAHPGDIIIIASDGYDMQLHNIKDINKQTNSSKYARLLFNANTSKTKDDVTIISAHIKSPIYQSRRKKQKQDWKARVANEM